MTAACIETVMHAAPVIVRPRAEAAQPQSADMRAALPVSPVECQAIFQPLPGMPFINEGKPPAEPGSLPAPHFISPFRGPDEI
jgi:hypothetical protein